MAKKTGMIKNDQTIGSDSNITDDFITQVVDLINSLNINPMVKGMKTSDFDSIAKAAAKEVSDTYAVPTYLSASEIKEILMQIKQVSDELASAEAKSDKVA